MNDRLRTAMLRAGVDAATLATVTDVDVKTVTRWLGGRVPHQRTRRVIADRLGEDEGALWPSARPDLGPGVSSVAEVLGAWAHRAHVPQDLWTKLLGGATQRVDLLGYAFPQLWESAPDAVESLVERCHRGLQVRVAIADPDCAHVMERDALEQLGGTLPGRVRLALRWVAPLVGAPNAAIGLHAVHLYNSIFRFDDQMIVTPHVFRAHGYQHPALHLRRLSGYGISETFAEQFQQVWDTARVLEAAP